MVAWPDFKKPSTFYGSSHVRWVDFTPVSPKVLDFISGEVNGHRGRRPEIGTQSGWRGGMTWEEKRKYIGNYMKYDSKKGL